MASEPTTEYERKRVENMRRNDEMMAALKLQSIALQFNPPQSSRVDPSRPHKKKKPRPETPNLVVRRSLRTSQLSHLQPPVDTMLSKESDSADSCSDSDSQAQNQNQNHHIKPPVKRRVEMDHRKKKKFWSDEDEIVILKCMIRFRKKGKDPFYQIAQFFDSVKHLLRPTDVNKEQLYYKIRNIRRKYLRALQKVNTTLRPRNKKVYQLSKKMWSEDILRLPPEVVKEDGEKNKSVLGLGIAASSAKPKAATSPHNFNLGDLFQKKGIAARFDKQWKNVMIAETKAYLQRIDLIREQTQAMLDELESTHL